MQSSGLCCKVLLSSAQPSIRLSVHPSKLKQHFFFFSHTLKLNGHNLQYPMSLHQEHEESLNTYACFQLMATVPQGPISFLEEIFLLLLFANKLGIECAPISSFDISSCIFASLISLMQFPVSDCKTSFWSCFKK